MHHDILKFINKQTCATVSCADENGRPYCFACFYAFNSEYMVLHYKSSNDTHHSELLTKNASIAGTIHPDKLNALIVQGIQFEGVLLSPGHSYAKKAFTTYHQKHPLALVKPADLWTIQINHIKMTDSSKGFGTKIEWWRQD